MGTEHNADVLYDRCMRDPVGSLFYQQDLMSFNIVSNVGDLQTLCEQLVQAERLRIFTDGGQICWKTRRRVDADKLASLPMDDRMVYNHIETASTAGMWSKSLRAKTNLHQTVVNKCLKTLEAQGLVREIKSAKFPARKIYMLRYLTPSEETTGGVFFTDGEMDMALIEALGEVILRFVQDYSWEEQSPTAGTPVSAYSTSSRKRSRFEMEIEEEPSVESDNGGSGSFVPPRNRVTNLALVPRRSSISYPTTSDIHKAIVDSQILNEGLDLSETHIQQLLESLVFDGRLERMRIPSRVGNGRSNGSALRSTASGGSMDVDGIGSIGKSASKLGNAASKPTGPNRNLYGYRTTRPLLFRPPVQPHYARPGAEDVEVEDTKPPVFYLQSSINGVSSAPCCQCPVFDLCETGGPVAPEKCEYYARWLGTELEWVPGMEDHAAAAMISQSGAGAGEEDDDPMGAERAAKVETTQPFEGICTVGDGFAVRLGDGRRRTWYHG